MNELSEYQMRPKEINSDYKHLPGLLGRIQYDRYPEARDYYNISVGEVGFAPSNYQQETELRESGKVWEHAPESIHEARIGASVGNPQATLQQMNTFFRSNDADYNQDKAYIYSLNPDQIERPIKGGTQAYHRETAPSGLSSEGINRDLSMWAVRGRRVMDQNRKLYKGFI